MSKSEELIQALCDHKDFRPYYHVDGYDSSPEGLVICDNCKLIFEDPERVAFNYMMMDARGVWIPDPSRTIRYP